MLRFILENIQLKCTYLKPNQTIARQDKSLLVNYLTCVSQPHTVLRSRISDSVFRLSIACYFMKFYSAKR